MTKKDARGVPGAGARTAYFIQRFDNWYSNDGPGKKYLFNVGQMFYIKFLINIS